MDEKAFAYWLQGFVELSNSDNISEAQWKVIKDHLQLVFNKQTPPSPFVLQEAAPVMPYNTTTITC